MNRIGPRLLTWGVVVGMCGACRRDGDVAPADSPGPPPTPPRSGLLVFPGALHVDDPGVNAFVERAMTECASGDYARFRLLWSVREEPLSQAEYEQGWQAVRRIRIRALEKVILAAAAQGESGKRDTVFCILADVELDPTHRAAKGQPRREVVLIIRRERGQWRLAHAPKAIRPWIKKRIRSRESTAEPQDRSKRTEPPD